MKKYIKIPNGRLFFKMILPYACVLMVPVFIWLGSNIYAMKNNEEKVVSLMIGNIQRSVNVIDSHLMQIENTVMQMSQNNAFDILFSEEKLSFEEKNHIQKMIASYHPETQLIQEIFVYSKASDMVISHSSVYNNPGEFYKYSCGFENSEEWSDKTREMTDIDGYVVGEGVENGTKAKKHSLAYLRVMPVEYRSKKRGVVGVMLDMSELLRSFDNLYSERNASVYVYNRKGDLIMSHGEKLANYTYDKSNKEQYTQIKENGEKIHKFTYFSTKNQWQYDVLITGNNVLREIVVLNSVLGAVSLFAFILGLVLCIYLTYGRQKAYMGIIKMVGEEDDDKLIKRFGKNEIELLQPYVNEVINESRQLKAIVEKHAKDRVGRMMRHLISAETTNEETAQKMCKEAGLDLQSEKFAVIVLRCSKSHIADEMYGQNTFIGRVISKYIPETACMYVEDARTMVAVMNYDIDTAEFFMSLRENISRMNLEEFYRYQTEVTVGVGDATEKLSEIGLSYRQAMSVVVYKCFTGTKNIYFYVELPTQQTMYSYSIEVEQKFIKELSLGKRDEALATLKEIYEANFTDRSLTSERINELFSEILSTINKFRHMHFSDEEHIDYSKYDFNVKSFFEYLNDFVVSTCENVEAFNNTIQNARFEKIIEYINDNYMKADMSLRSIAYEFGFSDIAHISKSFKKYMNENFSAYLERIRVEKACLMMEEGKRIKEIWNEVGYLSDVSFRRAFKRRVGISPSDYLKNTKYKN